MSMRGSVTLDRSECTTDPRVDPIARSHPMHLVHRMVVKRCDDLAIPGLGEGGSSLAYRFPDDCRPHSTTRKLTRVLEELEPR